MSGIENDGNNDRYAPPKAPIGDLPEGVSNSFITLYWTGRGKLWKIYWIYGIAGGWLAGILIGISVRLSGVSPRALMAVFLPFNIWVLVSVWRCAFNAENRTWGYVARVAVLIGFIFLLYHIVVGRSLIGALIGR
jgi:hypothetical protein